jgi:RNA polymerase-binding transcription factor DksA
MADAGTDNFDRDFALSLVSSEQDALFEIEEAIQRIYDGSYGICEITGKPINKDRLEAVPFTRYSVEGQRQFESTGRKKEKRTGVFIDSSVEAAAQFTDDDSGG